MAPSSYTLDNNSGGGTQLSYLTLWSAALNQQRRSPYTSYLHSVLSDVTVNPNAYHSYSMQWNASAGKANLYVDGELVKQLRNLPVSINASYLTFSVWFPNAWAGLPLFDNCSSYLDEVHVVKLEAAGDRWCDFMNLQDDIPCTLHRTCTRWVLSNCLMPVFLATCVESTLILDESNQNASQIVNGTCHFALNPIYSTNQKANAFN